MFRIDGILFSFRIWIWQQGMMRERLDGKGVRRVEIEILFEAVGVKEVIANPSGRHRGKLPRIEIKLESLPRPRNDEEIRLCAQQTKHHHIE